MSRERCKLRDSLSVKLYSKEGKLKREISTDKTSLLDQILRFLTEVLENK